MRDKSKKIQDKPAQIIALACRYANAFEPPLKIATVSKRLFDNGTRLDQLVDGGDLNSRTVDDVVAWFDDNWPADAVWPAKTERPSLIVEAAPATDPNGASHEPPPNGAASHSSSSAVSPVAAGASVSPSDPLEREAIHG
ncbi:MAG: hypothetical protein AAGI03_01475 [Pseudomonadota bacterium]